MGVLLHFQDLLEASKNSSVVNLPNLKDINLKIQYENENSEDVATSYSGAKPILPFAASEVFQAPIASSRRLTALSKECKSVYEITFDVKNSNFNFQAGDTIGVIAQNTASDVNQIISLLDLKSQIDLPYILSIEGNRKGVKIPPHVPVKSTLRHVLNYCVDLRAVIKKLFVLALSKHTKNEDERKVLEYICSKEGSVSYTTHILNNNITIIDVFLMFQSCRPPIEVLLENLPRLLPRPYSIVNTGLKEPEVIRICFSVLNSGNRKGVVTSGLEQLILSETSLEHGLSNLSLEDKEKAKVPIYLRKNMSGFLLPDNLQRPLILIGPGTGVAPFLGFLNERELQKRKSEVSIGDVWLFFGCRNPALDFIYEEELNKFRQSGVLTKLCTAFSRIENAEFKYVQDALMKHGAEISNLIIQGASIFVCGDLKNMASQMKEVLINIIVDNLNKSKVEAEAMVIEMQKEKRYLVDTWI